MTGPEMALLFFIILKYNSMNIFTEKRSATVKVNYPKVEYSESRILKDTKKDTLAKIDLKMFYANASSHNFCLVKNYETIIELYAWILSPTKLNQI